MENVYKLNEFIGKLPNPKHFPIQGAMIIAFKDKPDVFADGFMLDLLVREVDKVMLQERVTRTIDTLYLNSVLEDGKRSKLLLSEPEFIYDTTYLAYVLFTPSGNAMVAQIKYYNYFRNRYPECKFYVRDETTKLIAVKVDKEVIGACMMMFCSQETLTKLKEERE